MSANEKPTRREFLKTGGAAIVGTALAAAGARAGQTTTATKPTRAKVPTRPFGKTGATVPCLAFGGAFDILSNQALLGQALASGVTYWDTAGSYARGKSERGIGKYFQKHPEARKKVFLISKLLARDPADLTRILNTSLETLKTDHLDLCFIHAVKRPDELTRWSQQWKAWAEKAKKAGKIRLFGFSTHREMAANLATAAKAGWVDAVMFTYNYRLMKDDKLKAAIDACHKAGKALAAMKTMALGPEQLTGVSGRPTAAQRRLLERFRGKGWTEAQAKLKIVWDDPRIATISTRMNTPAMLMENIAAAVSRKQLSGEDARLLLEQGEQTRSGYCAGCGGICESAVAGNVPICDVMRYLMYYHSYGERVRGRRLFGALPAAARRRITRVDYSRAERQCPNGLPIAQLMKQAARTLA